MAISSPRSPQQPYPVAELAECTRQYLEIKRRVSELVGGISPAAFNWRPHPAKWSIGQNLEHLNREGREQIPVVERLVERGLAEGIIARPPYRHSWFGEWYIGALEPPYRAKVKTMARFEPPPELQIEPIVSEFMAQQDRLLTCIRQAEGLDLGRLRSALTYLKWGNPSLTLGQWMRYIAAHERRHLWYIETFVRASPGFPWT